MLKHPKTLKLLTINLTKAVKTLKHISNIILEYKTTKHIPELKKTLNELERDTIQSLALRFELCSAVIVLKYSLFVCTLLGGISKNIRQQIYLLQALMYLVVPIWVSCLLQDLMYVEAFQLVLKTWTSSFVFAQILLSLLLKE